MIRLLVASPYPMARAGLQALLEQQEDFAIVGQASGGEELIASVEDLRPDVTLLDLAGDDASPIARLAALAPGMGLVVLGGDPAGEAPARALAAGARGYLLREAAAEELAAAVRAVHQGLVVLHPAAARAGAATSPAGPAPAQSGREALTARELEVLGLLAQGLPNKTIATRLHLSEHTVKFHVASIIAKLGAASRTEAVTLAARQGLIAL